MSPVIKIPLTFHHNNRNKFLQCGLLQHCAARNHAGQWSWQLPNGMPFDSPSLSMFLIKKSFFSPGNLTQLTSGSAPKVLARLSHKSFVHLLKSLCSQRWRPRLRPENNAEEGPTSPKRQAFSFFRPPAGGGWMCLQPEAASGRKARTRRVPAAVQERCCSFAEVWHPSLQSSPLKG